VRQFVKHHLKQLRTVPVWFFSSGPLDDSASHGEIPATTQVAVLADRAGAKGHVTFGGRLEPEVKGFPARAMAKTMSGDWRSPDAISAWAARIAAELPTSTPGTPIEHPARSIPRLIAHAVIGWAMCATTWCVFWYFLGRTAALVLHSIAAPLLFGAVAWSYFSARGARDPLPTAVSWTVIIAGLDVAVASMQRNFDMFASMAGTWLPFGLIFLVTWTTGVVLSTRPWTRNAATRA
jgi:hypothetical protein